MPIHFLQKEGCDVRVEVNAEYDPIRIKILGYTGEAEGVLVEVGAELNATDIRRLYDDGWRLIGDGIKSKTSVEVTNP